MKYWLIKTEPTEFSLNDLKKLKTKTIAWDGVRNYQARNYLKQMKLHDQAFFYHSSCKIPGIVGIVEVARESYPDDTAFNQGSPYYDPKSSTENPRWVKVDFRLVRELERQITLKELKSFKELQSLPLAKKASRLSVMAVTTQAWNFILQLEKAKNEAV